MARGDDTPGAVHPETIEPTAFRPPGALTGFAWPALPWARLAMLATLLGAAAVLLFIFGARSVEIDIEPSHARLTVGGGFAPHLGTRWMLLPGQRLVEAAAPGYRPLRERVRIGRAAHQRVALRMRPLPGHLVIALTPAIAAEVLVDEQPVGKAPGRIEAIEAGARLVTVRAPRHLDFTTTVDIIGKDQTQDLAITLQPAWADFSIASQPEGAQVQSDKQVLGVTPLRAELLQGTRVVVVSKPGYKPWQRQVEVVAGQPVSILDVRLQKDDGYFSIVSTPDGAAVTVDGRYKGETPLKFAVTPDREHDVVVLKTGYLPGRARLGVASGVTREIPLTLTPDLAVVELETTPADAELLLDGNPHGSATQRLELPTYEHEIIVRKAGYATYRTRVTPRKGVIKKLQIRLKTAAEMAALDAARQPPPVPVPGAPVPDATAPAAAANAAGNAEAQRIANQMSAPFLPPELAAQLPPPAVEFAGEGIVKSSLGQELKLVRGGEFRIARGGSVRLSRAFYLGLREVSNAEYRRFIGSHVSGGAPGQDLNADHLPVASITWEAAAAYCNWLSRRESLPPFYQLKFGRVLGVNPDAVGYRLPTEAEWEFAARIAPDQSIVEFPWAGRFPPRGRVGNFADRTARDVVGDVIADFEDGFAAAAPVGSFPPNLRGFHDLGGNVSEWIHDAFDAGPPAAGADPLGPAQGKGHVVRGSSWAHAAPRELRFDHRTGSTGARRDLGFRLARYAQ